MKSNIEKFFLTILVANFLLLSLFSSKLGENIVTTKRKVTVERASQIDEKYLELGDYNCLAVVSSMTYNADGVMFEFTQSRHRPDKFAFYDLAHRIK